MRKAWKLLKVIHTFCIAHEIHNWLMKDCFPQLTHVPDLLNKVQKIINKFRYRQQELEEEFIRLTDQMRDDLLRAINETGEVLDADLASSFVDGEDLGQLNDDIENDDLQLDSRNNQCSSKPNYLTSMNSIDQNKFHI
jgi:hypothetical protein